MNVKTKKLQPIVHMYNVHMNYLRFEWNASKAQSNKNKYGVSFEEPKSAFFDEQAIVYFDPENSEDEDRFLLLGTRSLNKEITRI